MSKKHPEKNTGKTAGDKPLSVRVSAMPGGDVFDPAKISLKELNDTVEITALCRGTREDGKSFYAYIAMNPEKYQAFEAAVKRREVVDFAEFGRIIEHGEGKEPPADVMRRMEKEHHVNHHFEDDLRREMQKTLDEYERMKKRGISDEQFLRQKVQEFLKDFQAQNGGGSSTQGS